MPIRFTLHLLLAIAAVSYGVAESLAATVSVNPIADALVSSANPASNYGGAGAIAVSAPGLPKGEFQSLLQFDLSSAKTSFDATFGVGNWSLQSASLQLVAANPNNALFNSSAAGQFAASWMQNDSWIEGAGTPAAPGASGVTWNSLPTVLSAGDQNLGTFNFSGATSGTDTYVLSLSSGLISDAVSGSLASIRLSAMQGDAVISGVFNSRSIATAASRPLLTVNAVAVREPSACFLTGFSLIGMAIMVRPGNSRTRISREG